ELRKGRGASGGATSLDAVGDLIEAVDAICAQEPQGFGFPRAYRSIDPGESGSPGLDATGQVGQRPGRKIGRDKSLADEPAGMPDAAVGIETHVGGPVPWHAQHPAPGVLDRCAVREIEHLLEQLTQLTYGPGVDLSVAVQSGSELVGKSAAT